MRKIIIFIFIALNFLCNSFSQEVDHALGNGKFLQFPDGDWRQVGFNKFTSSKIDFDGFLFERQNINKSPVFLIVQKQFQKRMGIIAGHA